MIIETKLLQDCSKKILEAVDKSASFEEAETVELLARDGVLYLNVTNREYYVSVKIPVKDVSDLHAVVKAKGFLNLISKLSTNEVELFTNDKSLVVKWNTGDYVIPFIADKNGEIITLNEIKLNNETNNFKINNEVLQSILKYNSRELLKSTCATDVQKLFYIDDNGAVTFSGGACVNSFKLEQPVTLFLSEKIIKLFKLFKKDTNFSIGQDMMGNKLVTKVTFSDGDVSLTAILNIDENKIRAFPVNAIRGLANATYDYTINVDKNSLLNALNRLLLFSDKLKSRVYVSFNSNSLTISDVSKVNKEVIPYTNVSLPIEDDSYFIVLDAVDFKLTLETCEDAYLNISFGNSQINMKEGHKAMVISRGNIKNLIPGE